MPVVVHLSDPHLDRSPERLRRLGAVLRELELLPVVDAVVATGDLADHGEPDEYDELFSTLRPLDPLLVVPGNHDRSGPLLAALARHGRAAGTEGTVDLPGLRLIGLDSHVDGRDDGLLGPSSLDYVEQQAAETDDPVVLAMHHPPTGVGHPVMDHMGLQNTDDLAAVLHRHENVVGLLTGHLHTAVATSFAGVPVRGAPGVASTLFLDGRADPLADPGAPPGFAVHTIEGSLLRSVFHHLRPSSP